MSKKKPHMKKKEPQPPINVDVDIDYDKLADAIVKAQEKANESKLKKKSASAGAFMLLSTAMFRIAAGIGLLMSFIAFLAWLQMIFTLPWNGILQVFTNISTIIISASAIAMLVLFSLLLQKSAKEMENETDRNYIVSVFSGLVSFVALIVSLVALYKGVS